MATDTPVTPGFRNVRDKYLALLLSDAQSQISPPSITTSPTSQPPLHTHTQPQPLPPPPPPPPPPPQTTTSSTTTPGWTPGNKFQFPSQHHHHHQQQQHHQLQQHQHLQHQQFPMTPAAWQSPVTPAPTEAEVRLAELTAGLVVAGDAESRQAEAIRRLTGQLQKSERRVKHLEEEVGLTTDINERRKHETNSTTSRVKTSGKKSQRPRSTPISEKRQSTGGANHSNHTILTSTKRKSKKLTNNPIPLYQHYDDHDHGSSSVANDEESKQLDKLKKEKQNWFLEKERSEKEAASLSRMLADIKRNTQRLVKERDDHLQVIARLQDRLSESNQNTNHNNHNNNNNIDNNHNSNMNFHQSQQKVQQYHLNEQVSSIQNQYIPPETNIPTRPKQYHNQNQNQQQHRLSPIAPPSNESSPKRVDVRTINDDTIRRMHDETLSSSSGKHTTSSNVNMDVQQNNDTYTKSNHESENDDIQMMNESNQNTTRGNGDSTRGLQRGETTERDQNIESSRERVEMEISEGLERESELQTELRIVVEENAKLSERIPSLETECVRLANRLRISEARFEQQQDNNNHNHNKRNRTQQTDHDNANKSSNEKDCSSIDKDKRNKDSTDKIYANIQKLIEEVDILEGVADAIHFGTKRSADGTDSIQVETGPVFNDMMNDRNGDVVMIRDVVQRIANVRSSLSLRYGRWLEAVGQQTQTETQLNLSCNSSKQQQQHHSQTKSKRRTHTHSSRSSRSSESSRNSRASRGSAGRESTHHPEETHDFTSMNTKVINRLIGDEK